VKKLPFLIFFLTTFFLGCADKGNINSNIQQEQAIVSTQKVRIEAEDKSTILFVATYLNNMQKYFASENEMIILSSYYSPISDESKLDLRELKIKINDKSAEVVELENSDELLKDVPINNIWSKHYLILSKKEDSDTLKLTVEIYPFPSVSLMLPKEI
jgi:NhaP-type Na+/H+ and K+/H+ antiporter